MKQLSGLEASFLYLETATNYGHVGGLSIFDAPEPKAVRTPADQEGHVEYLAQLAPYTRRRLVEVPFGFDHPYWIEDPNFDREYHERAIAVPAPGDERQLERIVSRIASRPLDRSRPLWETYTILGADGGKHFAVYGKTHRCAIDCESGVDLALASLSLTSEPVTFPMPERRWKPEAVPTQFEMLGRGLGGALTTPLKLLGWSRRILRDTVNAVRGEREAGSLRERVPRLLNQLRSTAPRTIFNQRLGPHRRFAWGSYPLDDLKAVKNAFGVTVDDVVLAMCAGMLREWLSRRGELPEASLVAMVPVSVRSEAQKGQEGHLVSAAVARLYTDIADPGERLRTVHDGMNGEKLLQRAVPAAAQIQLLDLVAPWALLQANRLAFRTRLTERIMPFNVVISNVPGPQFPLYMDGVKVLASYPFSPITDGTGLNITVGSYNGSTDWGVVVDPDIVPNPWEMIDGLGAALEELKALAEEEPSART